MLTWRAARRAIGSLIFILCPALHAQTLAQSVNYPVGSNPFGVAAADFNRDGKPDLVVVNQTSNTISVLLNVANGTFGTATAYPTGASPQFVTVGDFNNDGTPDVIVANTNSSTIGIFLGNGDGTLRPMVSIDVGFEPIALAVADFNSDGRLDIAVANFGSNTVSVLLGNGDGSFQVPTDYAVDINPRSIVAGDFNGDGKLDIAVSHGVFTISVLLNAGNGTFAPAVNSKFTFGGGSIAAGDLNGDGRLDLVLANQGIGGFSVLLGAGDGTFSVLAQFSTFAVLFPNSIALADMNGDGHIDLIAADTITGVNVFGGDGKGNFSAPARFFADVRPWYAITADFNRDGRPDVAVVNASSNDVSVLLNTTVTAAASTTGWRMQGINPSRTNAATVKGPETIPGFKILATNVNGALGRIALDGSLVLMQPLVANSTPIFGVVSSYSSGGKLRWTTNVPTDLFGLRDIAVSRFGTVYVTPSATLSNLIALDANSGQQLWTQTNDTANRSHPLAVGSDGTIYFTSGAGPLQGKISAVNPDGSLKWQITGPESNIALSTDESSLYVLTTKGIAAPTGDVRRYSTADGSFVANTPCDPRGDIYAFAPWNVLYTGDGNNDLLAFPPDLQSCPVISAHGMVAVGIANITTTGRIVTVNIDGTLGGLDQLGTLLWKSAEPLSQAFSSADAVIYAVAPITNDLVALESEHGSVLWRQHFNDPITGDFLADDGNIYLTAGSTIFVSSPARPLGTIVVTTDNSAAAFTISDGGSNTFMGGGTSFTQTAPAGKYTITFEQVAGFITPPQETKTLDSNNKIEFIASYVQHIAVSPNTLEFDYPRGAAGLIPQQELSIQTSATPVHVSISTSTETGGNWLSISGTNLTTPANILVGVSNSLPEGQYRGAVHIHAFGAVDSNDLTVPVSLTVGPPAAVQINVELLDPAPVVENMQIVSPDTPAHISLLSSPTLQPLEGAATDGVSKLLVRISVSQPGETVLFLTDSLGEVSLPPEEAGTIPSDTLPTVGDNKVFAVYGAPNQFARSQVPSDKDASQRQIYVRAVFIPPDGPALRSELFPIVLERPPIVLVHGLWSDDSAWDNFPLTSSVNCADTGKFYACRINYGPDAASTFAVIASEIGPVVRAKIAQFRKDRHVAALQADVIAHSMGGDIVRTLPLCNTTVAACTFTYKTSANLGFGDVHSLVTIGTPHLGTPIANDLIQNLTTRCCPYLRCFGKGPLFRDAFKAVTGNSLDGGAVQDLQENSIAINAVRNSTADFPMHFVVGIANSTDESLLDDGLVKTIRSQCSSNILPEHIKSIFNMDSDLLVPENSQRNTSVIVSSHCVTRSLNLIHTSILANPGQTGFSPDELSSPTLGLDILNLLDSPASFCK